MTFDLLSPQAPPLPQKLPGFVKQAIQNVPEIMKPAAANAIFPPAAAHMSNVKFRYVDNVLHEPIFMEGCVSASGNGKGYLDPMIEAIICFLRRHDEESSRKLEDWSRRHKAAANNQSKPDRPIDAAILVPEIDITKPALIQLLKDAEHEGNRTLYSIIPELDLLNQCCGGHNKVTRVIRIDFDSKRMGAQRATPEGVSGNPTVRWNFNFSCVEQKARQFFNNCLLDGTLGRIGISYMPKPERRNHKIPRQGDYDSRYQSRLEVYLERLRATSGEIKVPRIGTLVERLAKEMGEIADMADDDVFESLYHRSLVIAWRKGCLLYVSEGYRWTPEIARFVEWSLYYDLWGKIILFAPQMVKCRQVERVDVRKSGPANMLDMLPDAFSLAQLEELRRQLEKPAGAGPQLTTWQARKYICYDKEQQLYLKTEEYFAHHPKPLKDG